jgi:hypothetical protein
MLKNEAPGDNPEALYRKRKKLCTSAYKSLVATS